jgi:hypothetical protein
MTVNLTGDGITGGGGTIIGSTSLSAASVALVKNNMAPVRTIITICANNLAIFDVPPLKISVRNITTKLKRIFFTIKDSPFR